MIKKIIFVLLIIALMMGACRSAKETQNLKNFSEEYTNLKNKYDETVKTVTTREQYLAFQKEKNTEMEALLNKYDKITSSDNAELLKTELLIEMTRLDEAEKKIDALLPKLQKKESELFNPATLKKVRILIYRQQPGEAVELLKTVEKELPPDLDLLSVYLYLALYSPDLPTAEAYGLKFLDAKDLPTELEPYKAGVYRNLASAAGDKGDREKAKQLLEKAVATASDPRQKKSLEAELNQLELLGKPAPALIAETWFNTAPISPRNLTGKVVLIDFWATWCAPCRTVIPRLSRIHEEYKDKGLVIIGLTKLYGNYTDDTGAEGAVDRTRELELIKAFSERHKIAYSVAVSDEGTNAEAYGVNAIPTLVLVDKKGNIAHIHVGAGMEQAIKDKITKLLEEQ